MNHFHFILILLFLVSVPVYAADSDILFRENFDSLAQWEPLTFPKIKAHSTRSWEGKSMVTYGLDICRVDFLESM